MLEGLVVLLMLVFLIVFQCRGLLSGRFILPSAFFLLSGCCALLDGDTQLARAAKENNIRIELNSLPWVGVRLLTSTELVFLNLRANLRKDLVERREWAR